MSMSSGDSHFVPLSQTNDKEAARRILAFGEVLWDVFPNKSVIGGAPFNFSAHYAKLGGEVALVTAVGQDTFGDKALSYMQEVGVVTDFVQKNDYQTGACYVTIDPDGVPSYELRCDMAYDHIVPNHTLWEELLKTKFQAVYFGTLAQRNEESRKTLSTILSRGDIEHVFFDVNIRQHWYSRDVVMQGLTACTILKVSREEAWVFERTGLADVVRDSFSRQEDYYESLARSLAKGFNISSVLFTLDKDGAMVYDAKQNTVYLSEKPSGRVVSTVGAGDSFSAGYMFSFLQGCPVDQCLRKAIILSNYVVQHTEAIPQYSTELKNALGFYS